MRWVDERLAEDANMGSSFAAAFDVEVAPTMLYRYTSMRHPYVLNRFTLRFDARKLEDQIDATIEMFHAAGGKDGIFRHRHYGDFSTNGFVNEPTSHDQLCVLINAPAKTYQITRWFKTPAASNPTEPRRKILLPLVGTVKVAKLNGVTWTEFTETTDYTVNYTTGVITLVNALGGGDTLYCGCEYDIPVMFETDLEAIDWTSFDIVSNQISLIEVRKIIA